MMRLNGKRIAFLVGPGFEDLEFWAVFMRLQEEGARLTTVGIRAGDVYTSKSGGMSAEAETGCHDVGHDAFDAVVIPGGWAPDKLRRYDGIKNLVKSVDDKGGIIGMICHAGLVGISAGIIREGEDAVGSEGIKDDLLNVGAVWRDEPAFVDGNHVWGRVVADIPAFNSILIDVIED
jgi:protease I